VWIENVSVDRNGECAVECVVRECECAQAECAVLSVTVPYLGNAPFKSPIKANHKHNC